MQVLDSFVYVAVTYSYSSSLSELIVWHSDPVDEILGQGQATTLSLNTNEALNIRSGFEK